jgi:hypothetical protein
MRALFATLLQCLALCFAAIPPAFAQEEPGPAVVDPTTEQGQQQAAAQQAAAQPQSLSVMVDGEPRSWAPVEKGVEKAWSDYLSGDFPAAVPIFERLAKIGHPVGQWLMGNVYFFGQGRPRDFQLAYQMFEGAADQGYFAAFAPTAQMYDQGLGTPKDPSKAYYWYNIAAAQLRDSIERTDMIKRREAVALQLTPAQIEAAQKRANAFKPKPIVPPDPEDLDWMNE